MNRARRQLTVSYLLENLEPRLVLTGFFGLGAELDASSSKLGAVLFNSFGDYDIATGQVNFENFTNSQPTLTDHIVNGISTGDDTLDAALQRFRNNGFRWQLNDGSDTNTSTALNAPNRLAFDTSFTGNDRVTTRIYGQQATGLTLADRNGSYRFTGLIYNATSGELNPSFGVSQILDGSLSGSEFSALGEFPLSATIGINDAFDDGFTRSNIPGYTSLFGPGAQTVLTTGFNQGPDSDFHSMSVAVRTDDPTQPQMGDEDMFRGDAFSFFSLGSMPFLGGSRTVGDNLSSGQHVLEFEPAGNRVHVSEVEFFLSDQSASLSQSGDWVIDADSSMRIELDNGLVLNLNFGGVDGDTIVAESVDDNGTVTPVFGAGGRLLNGTPGPVNNEAPTDVGVCFKSVSVELRDGEHFILGEGDNGITYVWKARDIEGSMEGYFGVGATLQDNGKTIVVMVTRDDGMIRELKRKEDGEWRVKNPIGGAVLSSGAMVAPSIETNPATGSQMQVAINADGSASSITPSLTDTGLPAIEALLIETGPINVSMGFDIDFQFDANYTTWGAYHGAFVDAAGDLVMLWNAPLTTGANFRVDNIQASADSPAPDPHSKISVATTTYGSIHVGYTAVNGDYGHLYWNIGQGGDWLYAPLETAVNAPSGGLNFDPHSAVTGFDPLEQQIFVIGVDQTTDRFATVDWRIDRRSWEYNPTVVDTFGEPFTLPDIGSAPADAVYTVRAHQTIADLFGDNADSQVPILGDLPVIGNFFRNTSMNSMTNNLIIFVTPTIFQPGG